MGSTTISYSLPEESPVTIEVFNVLGQRVATLVEATSKPAGRHAIAWDARHMAQGKLPSGTYVVRFEAGSYSKTMKIMVVR